MGYTANVLRVMIASPSDTLDARDAVESAIYGWNDTNARSKQVILQPWRWESSAIPMLGAGPQSLINSQGVDESDIVFALFGSRLGSPTPDAVSGTVEEIERAVEQGKPVHLYFSVAPLPNDVDTAQLEGLRAFKKEIQERGLLGEFSNANQLTHEVWKAIEHDIPQFGLGVPLITAAAGVNFVVQPKQEREQYSDSKGRLKTRARHWIEITNDGNVDAQDVTFEPAHGASSGMHLVADGSPTVIHKGQTRRLNVSYTFGREAPPVLRVNWTEDGQHRYRDFHVG